MDEAQTAYAEQISIARELLDAYGDSVPALEVMALVKEAWVRLCNRAVQAWRPSRTCEALWIFTSGLHWLCRMSRTMPKMCSGWKQRCKRSASPLTEVDDQIGLMGWF